SSRYVRASWFCAAILLGWCSRTASDSWLTTSGSRRTRPLALRARRPRRARKPQLVHDARQGPLQGAEVAEDIGCGDNRRDDLQPLEKIAVGHRNAHHEHAHPSRTQPRQRIIQRIDSGLVHVGGTVHTQNQDPALDRRLTRDVQELARETEEERA